VLARMSDAGALKALVTGSGPTVIGLFPGRDEADHAAARLPGALVAELAGSRA